MPLHDRRRKRAAPKDNRAFAFDLFHQLADDSSDNLFFSPHSLSVALAMLQGGARGATASQLASALHFDLPADQLHPAFNRLALELDSRSELSPDEYKGGEGFQLSIVNQLFGQTGYPFQTPWLDLLAVNYGASLRLLDFASDPDGNRVLINDWVQAVTADRIIDLLPDGSISTNTRFVLVNAIYFKASWDTPFDPADTTDAWFSPLAGDTVSVTTMHGVLETSCGSGTGFALADLPYAGQDLGMTLLVPDAGQFLAVQAALDGSTLDAALASLAPCELTVSLPRFSFKSAFNAKDPLQALGMVDAFSDAADFTGISAEPGLQVSGVYHQAFVAVDETGTEAAAATAIVGDGTSVPEPVTITVDRPFLFLIRDRPTGEILFLGRVMNPS